MNQKAIILLFAVVSLIFCSAPSSLWISQQSYSLNKAGRKWQAFTPVVYGGSGKYLIKYSDIPPEWDDYSGAPFPVTDNALLIPQKVNGRFQVQV